MNRQDTIREIIDELIPTFINFYNLEDSFKKIKQLTSRHNSEVPDENVAVLFILNRTMDLSNLLPGSNISERETMGLEIIQALRDKTLDTNRYRSMDNFEELSNIIDIVTNEIITLNIKGFEIV